jgi:hypothetical protein
MNEKAHTRTISISTVDKDDYIEVTGVLTDVRHCDYYLISGQHREAGKLHEMSLTVKLSLPDLIITDISAKLCTAPREDCFKTDETIKAFIGLQIKGGFSSKVRKSMMADEGCTHLNHLMITMAPAILQGYWAVQAQKKPGKKLEGKSMERAEMMTAFLKDSCYAWRQDGEAFQRLIALMNKNQEL